MMRRCFSVLRLLLATILAGPLFVATTTMARAEGDDGAEPTTTVPTNTRLGIGVLLAPGEDTNGDGLEQTNRLWFALEPGSASSRTLKVSSSSRVTQRVSLLTVAAAREDGQGLSQDPQREDPLASWFSFVPTEFVLAPDASQDVILTVSAPADAQTGTLENYIKVRAVGVTESTAQYKIPTAVSFVQPTMVMVGDAEQLKLDFSIVDVEGFKGQEGPTLRIYFQNSGGIPISLTGTVQLSSLDFDGVRSPNYEFRSSIILPSSGGFADVLMSDPVAAGRWRVFVAAFQGSNKKSATFERDLTFESEPTGPTTSRSWSSQRVLLILMSIALLVLARRNLQANSKSDVEIGAEVSTEPSSLSRLLTRLQQNWESARRADDLNRQQMTDSPTGSPDTATAEVGVETVSVEATVTEVPHTAPQPEPPPLRAALPPDPPKSEKSPQPEPPRVERGPDDDSEGDLVSNADALRVLRALFDEGIITEGEYARKRKEILRRI